MRILGIDPGTWKMGIGVVEKDAQGYRATHYETLLLKGPRDHFTLAQRLKKIYDGLNEIFKIYQPDVVALEDLFYAQNFQAACRIGEARAVAILAATNFDIKVAEYAPTRVKQAISGSGKASKIQIQYMVRHLLKLKENPASDAADALAVALCHGQSLKTKEYVRLS